MKIITGCVGCFLGCIIYVVMAQDKYIWASYRGAMHIIYWGYRGENLGYRGESLGYKGKNLGYKGIAKMVVNVYNIAIDSPYDYIVLYRKDNHNRMGECVMATKSFIKEFAVNKANAARVAKALNNPKPITLSAYVRTSDVKKDKIKKFLRLEE